MSLPFASVPAKATVTALFTSASWLEIEDNDGASFRPSRPHPVRIVIDKIDNTITL